MWWRNSLTAATSESSAREPPHTVPLLQQPSRKPAGSLRWTAPDTLTERDYEQIALQLTGHARALASAVGRRSVAAREAAGTDAATRTDCASMIPAEGSVWRPLAPLTLPRSRSWNSAASPCSRHRRERHSPGPRRASPRASPARRPARDQVPDHVRYLAVAVALGLPAPALRPGRHGPQRADGRPVHVRHVRRDTGAPGRDDRPRSRTRARGNRTTGRPS